MKKLILFLSLPALLFVGNIFAAKGIIVDVNPSGVHGTIVVTDSDPNEEVQVGDCVSFTMPAANYVVGGQQRIKKGTNVLYEAKRNGNSNKFTVVSGTLKIVGPVGCPCFGCCN